jgi:hypothetical protein
MSKDPNPCHLRGRVLQTLASAANAGVSQTYERWFTLARNPTADDQYSYSSRFTWVRQVIFLLKSSNLFTSEKIFTHSKNSAISSNALLAVSSIAHYSHSVWFNVSFFCSLDRLMPIKLKGQNFQDAILSFYHRYL